MTPRTLTASGAIFDRNLVGYLNRIAVLHNGEPPRTTTEAIDATVVQVMNSILIAELIGAVWRPAPLDEDGPGVGGAKTPKAQYGAMVAPTKTGWAVPRDGQHMSLVSVQWQAEVTDQPFRLIRVYGVNTHQWEIKEYGFVNAQGRGYWVDGFKSGRLLDAKYIPERWLGPDGRLKEFQAKFMMEDLLAKAQVQIEVAQGTHPIDWVFNSQPALNAVVAWFEETGNAGILKQITFRTLGG